MWSRLLSFPRRQLWRARITRWGVGYPDPEMRALGQLCDPGKLSIDVGASLGAYTLHLLAHSAAVWAFEPRAAAQAALRAMFTTSALVIRGEALSDTTGEATFTHCTTEPGRSTLAASNPISGTRETVAVCTLDSLTPPPVGFMKIDVEGHEEAVLRGAGAALERDHPALLLEIEERHAPGATVRIPALLATLGYTGRFLLSGQWTPIAEFRPEKHQRIGVVPYINNFVFVMRP